VLDVIMFFKKSGNITADLINLAHKVDLLEGEILALNRMVKALIHDSDKQDGHIRSLRGAINRMKGMADPKEEDINTSSPTDYLKKL
jgi:hypothetical protein